MTNCQVALRSFRSISIQDRRHCQVSSSIDRSQLVTEMVQHLCWWGGGGGGWTPWPIVAGKPYRSVSTRDVVI